MSDQITEAEILEIEKHARRIVKTIINAVLDVLEERGVLQLTRPRR